MIQHIILPLHSATVSIRLPKSAHILSAFTKGNDVSYLEVAALKEEFDADPKDAQKWASRTLEVYFEGEVRNGTLVEIPVASDTRRFVGKFETKETPAVWHVFEILP